MVWTQESCHKYINYDNPGECSPETVRGDNDWRFDNLSESHLQSQVNCGMSVDGINVSGCNLIGQWSQDVIGHSSVSRDVIGHSSVSRDVIGHWSVSHDVIDCKSDWCVWICLLLVKSKRDNTVAMVTYYNKDPPMRHWFNNIIAFDVGRTHS